MCGRPNVRVFAPMESHLRSQSMALIRDVSHAQAAVAFPANCRSQDVTAVAILVSRRR
jgi:hypothetical protein